MTTRSATFSDALRVPEFRWLWLAGAQSQIGDQLARVALALLVFDRTGSAAETALVYALTFVPAILGSLLLGGLADRFVRRDVLVTCDLLRVPLLALMAIPAIPTFYLGVLLVLVVLLEAPFNSANLAVLPQILDDERYVAGSGLRMFTDQLAQIFGFALGGALVAVIGSHSALLLDAGTFLISGVVIAWTVRPRPASATGLAHEIDSAVDPVVRDRSSIRSAIALIRADPRLWSLLGLAWLAAFYVIPEGLAAPYAHSLGKGAVAVGILMAAMPAGQALGSWLLVRYVPDATRLRLLGPMAVATGLPLIACFAGPVLAVSTLLWALTGLAASFQVQAVATFVRTVPDDRRGQVVGLASSGLLAVQGLGILAGGLMGQRLDASRVIAIAGLAIVLTGIPLAVEWRRTLHAVQP